ncbi:hypothetical protein SCP_0109790 [Sparassis crispa]|uniref:C2H2-type domain-containing protein n=1 Tax=Sparassis crispa TaxID=139825 RepID=A0A401G7G2_9APHY|nr:hypothetical protein SCP_0109790 [Sparassis crispa]GBE78097.1 hypothetical protein SCP_0109790 [Sparassis crispa]
MHFQCLPTCGRSFDSQHGLSIHQASCKELNERDSTLNNLAEKLAAKAARKRRRIDDNAAMATAPPDAAGPGFMPDGHEPLDVEMADVGGVGPSPAAEVSIPMPDQYQGPEVGLDVPTGRGLRKKQPTWKVLEHLPEPSTPFPDPVEVPEPGDEYVRSPEANDSAETSIILRVVRTAKNIFGLFREYQKLPSHNPDDTTSLSDMAYVQPSNSDTAHSRHALAVPSNPIAAMASSSFAPFANMSIFRLMNWMWSGSHIKSIDELDKLVNGVILAPDFHKEDLQGFDVKRETAKLDKAAQSTETVAQDGWNEAEVEIEVPDGKKHQSESDGSIPCFKVPGLHHRSLIKVIKATRTDPAAVDFHTTPFKQFWQQASGSTERVYDELYSTDAFIDAHEDLLQKPQEPGCTLERSISALMFWSDSTHLASFGNASLWPLYLFFGNQSKYICCKPRAAACHHIAYIPKLPDTFYDFYYSLTGNGPSADILTHCRRELMHAVWRLLLDEDFMHAYEHGIVIQCADGVTRRIYPRIFTYSADYPEKVLLATVRNLGKCMKRDDARRVKEERINDSSFRNKISIARKAVYELGKTIKSTVVEALLAAYSFVPTSNAFSEKLSPLGFNLFGMLVVDLMHEFELGVWKAVFTHLIRILVAVGGDAVAKFNYRYREVPTFGRSTIRRFSQNVSALKKLAARDYEDFLQCALPVFEGLLPEPYNKEILDLLFTLAEWHAGAKLRLHTETILKILREVTTELGARLRKFVKNTCPQFDTKELPRKEAARGRRRQTKKTTASMAGTGGAKRKMLNLGTYKCHALGDYPRQIEIYGTTDSYSTQPGELEHRRVKRYYARTNKNNATRQITLLQRREQIMQTRTLNFTVQKPLGRRLRRSAVSSGQPEVLPYTPPEAHHHISHSRNFPVKLSVWLGDNLDDPLMKDFLPKLQDHLLGRLFSPGLAADGHQFAQEDRNRLLIQNHRIFAHQVLRINYTSYDVRRCQDSINPRNHADIMTLAPEHGHSDDTHPFAYGRVLGIFHADIVHNIPGSGPVLQCLEFLWVHWFRRDRHWKAGFGRKRLHRVEFVPTAEPNASGFLDPDEVIRGVHLIPAFAHGYAATQLDDSTESSDWKYYYVNCFVDRDMYICHLGDGVGHYIVNMTEAREDGTEERQATEDDGEHEEAREDGEEEKEDSEGEDEDENANKDSEDEDGEDGEDGEDDDGEDGEDDDGEDGEDDDGEDGEDDDGEDGKDLDEEDDGEGLPDEAEEGYGEL